MYKIFTILLIIFISGCTNYDINNNDSETFAFEENDKPKETLEKVKEVFSYDGDNSEKVKEKLFYDFNDYRKKNGHKEFSIEDKRNSVAKEDIYKIIKNFELYENNEHSTTYGYVPYHENVIGCGNTYSIESMSSCIFEEVKSEIISGDIGLNIGFEVKYNNADENMYYIIVY